MKNVIKSAMALVFIVACLLLITCSDLMSGEGDALISVTIGEGTPRSIVAWADTLDSTDLIHTVTVSDGPGTAPPSQTIPAGGGTAKFWVSPGQWTISVVASLPNGEVVAVGSETKKIKQGKNIITIPMKEPSDFDSFEVTFDANGGTFDIAGGGEPKQTTSQFVKKYSKATPPYRAPTFSGRSFAGWDTEKTSPTEYDFDTPVTGPITLYAKWEFRVESDYQWGAALNVIKSSDDTYFVINVINDINDITLIDNTFGDKGDIINVTIKGNNTTLSLASTVTGALLTIGQGQTVILDDSIKLKGFESNNTALVYVDGGNLIMQGSSEVSENNGGGVYVANGSFKLTDNASVHDNSGGIGGGVCVSSGGVFTMSGGSIKNNNSGGSGGGVCVVDNDTITTDGNTEGGSFIMTGGTISGNNGENGCGVCVTTGQFKMTGGTITGNFDDSGCIGGGVLVDSGGTFEMTGGEISTNNAGSGGGVFLYGVATFTMSAGTITGNIAKSRFDECGGGGVFVSAGTTFTMLGGIIKSNDGFSGGGVFVQYGGTFTKSGTNSGTIFGSDAPSADQNTACEETNYGNAVYVYIDSSTIFIRDNTAGPGDPIDSTTRQGLNQKQ